MKIDVIVLLGLCVACSGEVGMLLTDGGPAPDIAMADGSAEDASRRDASGSATDCMLAGRAFAAGESASYYTSASAPDCEAVRRESVCGEDARWNPAIEGETYESCGSDGGPVIVTFASAPPVIDAGESAQLTWVVENADSVTLTEVGDVASEGSAEVMPTATTSYTLSAQNAAGRSESTTVLVVRTQGTDEWPAWRRGLSAFEWHELPDTSLADTPIATALIGEQDANGRTIGGRRGSILGAWNGLAANTDTSRVYSAGNGGHADYAGNEVYEIDFSAEEPSWRVLREPTEPRFIVSSTRDAQFHYYLDGRPSSTHTYYALQFLESRNSVFKFGAGSIWGTGNENNAHTDAFDLDLNDWVPEGTHPDFNDTNRGGPNLSVCKSRATQHVYVAGRGALRRFDAATGTYEMMASYLQNYTEVLRAACAVNDSTNEVVFFRNAYGEPTSGLVLDIDARELREIEFSGPATRRPGITWSEAYAWFDETLSAFVLKPSEGGSVVRIDPTTFATSLLTTMGGESMPNAANGVQTRFQYLPRLRGYAYFPTGTQNGWFLAME